MNAEVEQRIVEMRFDNEQFEKAAKQSLATLDKLDNILDMLGEGGIDKLSSALDTVQSRFSALGIAGAAAIENIANRVVNLTMNLATAIPSRLLAQIQSGGEQRALNIESAKFQLKGLGVAWEEVADDIDHAVMGTAYGVDEAAKAAAILAASKVDYKNTVDQVSDLGVVLRSISGIAAMTNSSYDDIANVMGDIFAMGKVTNGELQRFELRGLNVVAKLSEVLKNTNGQIQYTEEQMRELISKGKIDALTFAKAMDAAFGEHATAANETYTGSLRNMNAALSRIGADFYSSSHEGMRKIFLAARKLFDRVRKITKPFAEGKFTEVFNKWIIRTSDLIEKLDLKWLQKLRDFFEKSDAWVKPVDVIIDKFYDLNEVMKRLFSNGQGRADVGDRFYWVFSIKKTLSEILPTLEKAKNAFDGLFGIFTSGSFGQRAFGNAANTLRDISKALEPIFDGVNKNLPDIQKLLEDVFDTLEITYQGAEKIFTSLLRLGSSVFNLFLALLLRFDKSGAGQKLLQTYQDAISGISNTASSGIDKMIAFVDMLTEIVQEGRPVSESLSSISSGFGWIGEKIGTIISGISTFLKYLLGIKEGETIFSKFGKMASKAGELIGVSFNDIRNAIAESFGKDGVGETAIDIAAALYTVLIGYRKLESIKFSKGRLGRVIDSLTKGLREVYNIVRSTNLLQIADDVETILRRTGGALRAFSDNLNSKSLINIGIAVITLAGGLVILASVAESGQLGNALLALAATMGILVTAMAALKKFTQGGLLKNITKGWKGILDVFKNGIGKYFDAMALKETAMAALMFAAAILVMAIAIGGLAFMFSKLSARDILLAGGAIVVLGVLLAGLIVWLQKATEKVGMFDSTKFIAIGVALVGLALGIVILAGAIAGLTYVFKDLQGGQIWAAIGAIGAVIIMMAALIGMMVMLSKWTKEIGGIKLALVAAAMIGMAIAIGMLAVVLVGLTYAFKNLESAWPVVGALVAIGVMLMALAGTLAFLSDMMAKVPIIKILAVAASMVLMGVAIGIVALAAVAFATAIQIGGFIKTVGGMVIVLAAMAAAVALLSLLGPKILIGAVALVAVGYAIKMVSEAFVSISEGLVVLAGALNMMPSDGSLDTIGTGLVSIGKGLAAIAGSAILFNWGDTEAFSSLVPLATALYELGKVDIPTLSDKKTGLPALAKALNSFGSMFGGIGSVGAHLVAGNVGLLEAGAAFGALGLGLQDLAPGLEAFNNIEGLDDSIRNLEALNVAIEGMVYFGLAELYRDMPKLAESLEKITAALGTLSENDITKVANLGDALGETFTKDSSKAMDALREELNELRRLLSTKAEEFIAEGSKLPESICAGIKNRGGDIGDELVNVLWDAYQAINSDAIKQSWVTAGGNITAGIANGILSRTSEAANAMKQMASALQRSFTVSLAIRSPSRVFEQLAEYVPEGAAVGIQNGTPGVVSAMANMVALMMVQMQLAQNEAESIDLTPHLTPVMDVEGMKRDIGYTDRLFLNSKLGQFSGVSGLTVNGDAISYNMQNKDIVTEIRHLENGVAKLGEAFSKMQMVLDSGVLVGQMANGMNQELGVIAMRERRQ